ncbi:MAG TPA: protein kinase [Ktedonobacteraceae bacterium]|nr:protein kinase [Ktedonobacteraceae bacterium]
MKGIEGLTLGRYELRRRIAQGGMAEVYLAYDRRVRRQVAVKVLYGRDEPFVRRFEREALAVGALSHNHILPLYDFGEQSPWYYLVMPYVDGCTLRDYLFRHKQLTLEEAASFLSQIASALQYAHEHGVVHRDVKPSNILLRQDGYAYLVDFGLAKAMQGGEALTSAGAMVGTPEYMAPEQSNGVSDYRSDIYSLGIILYQMLTGQLPFLAESPVAVSLKHIQSTPIRPRTLNSSIPQNIEDVILKAMAKNPDQRYQAAKDLATAFWKALQQEMLKAHASAEHAEGTDENLRQSTGEANEDEKSYANGVTATRIASEQISDTQPGEIIQVELRPPIMPLRFPLTDKPGLASMPDTTSLPPSGPLSYRLRHLKKRSLAALISLLVLVIALPLGMLTWQTQHGHLSDLSPAQQVAATATALSQAQMEATLAAQARVQATAGITSSIGAGKVLYTDPLTARGGGWVDDGQQCFFDARGYHVQTTHAHEFAWCYTGRQTFANIVISAQAHLVRGEVYGLVFRLNPGAQQFYALEINSHGEYRFVLATGSNPNAWITLIDWTHSSAILTGQQPTNTVLAIASGYSFRFYVNKQLIVTNYTNTAYASGVIGFMVGGDGPRGTEAVFSNLFVFQK